MITESLIKAPDQPAFHSDRRRKARGRQEVHQVSDSTVKLVVGTVKTNGNIGILLNPSGRCPLPHPRNRVAHRSERSRNRYRQVSSDTSPVSNVANTWPASPSCSLSR
jgi:hypothetical protein